MVAAWWLCHLVRWRGWETGGLGDWAGEECSCQTIHESNIGLEYGIKLSDYNQRMDTSEIQNAANDKYSEKCRLVQMLQVN